MSTLQMKILAKVYLIVKVHNFTGLPIEHPMCVLYPQKICAVLEHYKSNQINSTITTSLVLHRIKANIIAMHFGTDQRGSTLLLTPIVIIIVIIISAKLL